ncbi:hypothetical protein ACQEWB_00395 [Streptomyces sp. CA-249302]|uniref:hypothetical protein n=1 Tax=Streptomyces sp. CA-249302 TaxID=3240058 RepID=UPI003D91C3AF
MPKAYAGVVGARARSDARAAALLGVGDFGAGGCDIERGWVERTGRWAWVERVLLADGQVREYRLPPAATSITVLVVIAALIGRKYLVLALTSGWGAGA